MAGRRLQHVGEHLLLDVNMLKRKSAGFTLMEMMITLVIFIALVAISIPSMRSLWQNNQLRTSADSLLSGAQIAKSEAMKRNARVYFFLTSTLSSDCVLGSDSRFWVVSLAPPNGMCEVFPSPTIAPQIIQTGRLADVTGNITVNATDSANSAAYAVGFNGSGFVANNADASSSITNIDVDAPKMGTDAHQLRIQVSSSGRIKMCSIGADAGDARACD